MTKYQVLLGNRHEEPIVLSWFYTKEEAFEYAKQEAFNRDFKENNIIPNIWTDGPANSAIYIKAVTVKQS